MKSRMKAHNSQLSNSFTNSLHATALGLYTYWVYANPENYSLLIILVFLFMFIGKILGVLAHLPAIETQRNRHVTVWILITLISVALNITTLIALNLKSIFLFIGILVSCFFSAMYLWSLSRSAGYFAFLVLGYLSTLIICIYTSIGILRFAWICLLLSNVVWILLEKIPFLRKKQWHNDIYHLLLIGSTYLLYDSVTLGLWNTGNAN
ncbi:hypothetical protein [Shewanella surugensis]|uniref:Uncharacterized protein n=1 Tax=Shewanella surugensis TaxID=212020 RepID=A0ABT0LK94_9GAMM|nr:hypothetical protein [Shewanella surugensis]MCL1128019.1 hypothetical protein [Shewanella surugensis]